MHRFSGRYPRTESREAAIQALEQFQIEREAAHAAESNREDFREAVVDYRPNGREIVIQRAPAGNQAGGESPNEEEIKQIERDAAAGKWDDAWGVEEEPDENNTGGGVRGRVEGFSRKSRRRLMKKFAALRRDAVPLFLTLTYHEKKPRPDEAKEDLHAMVQQLRREYTEQPVEPSKWSLFWRMEWQKRGVIHFHLMIYGPTFIHKDKLKRWWHRISGEDDQWANMQTARRPPAEPPDVEEIKRIYTGSPHREMGAWIEKPRAPGRVRYYVSKYIAKEDTGEHEPEGWTGRVWGIRNRKFLPVAKWATRPVRVSWKVAYALQENLLCEWHDGEIPDVIPYNLTVFSENPILWLAQHFP